MIEKIKQFYLETISKKDKTVFGVTFCVGMLAHLYMYTNTIPNFDGISRMYDEQQMTIAGRWFLHYASYLNGFMQMPLVIGVITMFFLALTAALVVKLFQMRSVVFGCMWGVVLVVFPAVADTNAYIYTAAAYGLSAFLAVAGVWMSRRWKWGFFGGSVLLALAMGIYQTYVTVAIVLAVLLILRETWKEEADTLQIFWQGIRYLIFLGLGSVLYYIILQIFLKVKNLQLWSYLGMSTVTDKYPIDQLGSILRETYAQVGEFFLKSGTTKVFAHPVMVGVNVLLLVVTIGMFLALVWKKRLWKQAVKLGAGLVMLLLLPLAVNFVQIISPFSAPRTIMQFAYVFLYLLPLLLADVWMEENLKKLGEAAVLVTAGGVLAVALYCWEYDNVLYTLLNQVHRATESYVTNLVSRVESCDGYTYGIPVVIVGSFPEGRYNTDIEGYNWVKSSSSLTSSVIPLNKHIYYYLNDWLNVPWEEPSEEVFEQITATEAFMQMPLYPDAGSVQIIDGCVVVKVKDTYSPRSEYEKQYEQRR